MIKKITESSVSKMGEKALRDNEIRGFSCQSKKTGKYFYYEYKSPVTGTNRKHPLGKHGEVTVDQARTMARAAAGDVATGNDPQEQKRERREEIEKARQNTLRAFIEGDFRSVTPEPTADEAEKNIKRHFSKWLDKPMSHITPFDMRKWLNNYPGAPSGGNRIMNDLRGILTKAVAAGYLEKTPMSEVKRLKEDKSKKIKYLTREYEKRLLAGLDEYDEYRRDLDNQEGKFADMLRPLVMVAIHTGMRKGELLNLKVNDIDFASGVITVVGMGDRSDSHPKKKVRTKSLQTRYIPMNEISSSILNDWLDQTGYTELVFPNNSGQRACDKYIDRRWYKAREAAGLTGKIDFHGLRHTFGTRLAELRVDLVTIQELMGHESLDVTAKYLHTSPERKHVAISELAGY
ncbi:tyrosine-type recombinase/integrase [Endozoicomonas sp. SCSIO W0465]|uniref:tyrosine-type recombinase/integrase n=1 Tax=Endozoicomonas sp. SCSIO W0465 TaxID=2918516 RepID=UPI0020757CB7|nr:tyrosine-type recombinase/integrase [Endozoicomonas sp. SCSIO W0465]USE36328.1 tyrosine-type recombinase/integrase [Endozoicomonas sp. SCSIO W0465]